MSKTYSVTDTVSLYRLFDVLRIPIRVAAPIINSVKTWEQACGPEWTVKRLKGLKALYLQHYAGDKEFRLDSELAVACHSDGTPKGPFRALWTMGYAYRTVNKVLSVLQLYTAFLHLGRPLASQLAKFHDAVERPRSSGELPPWQLRRGALRLFRRAWENSSFDSVQSWTTTTKRVLHLDVSKGLVKVPENSITVNDHTADLLLLIGPWLDVYHIRRLFVECGVNEVKFWKWTTSDIIDGLKATNSAAPMLPIVESSMLSPIVGNIGFIQERGLKLRAVANPLRLIQLAFSRLKNALSRYAKYLPWDCTFDQDKGVRWAQRMLRSGKKLYAFDLSNASDTIPLEDQIALLKYLEPSNDVTYIGSIELLEKVARARWVDPTKESGFLSWAKGQPLGIGCSFGLFSVAHGLRLDQLAYERGLKSAFVVLGDDVIVVEELAQPYSHFLKEIWGCDFSVDKTLVSNTITEFASRLTTSDRTHKTWKFPKSRRLFSFRDPLDLLRRYGKGAITLVPEDLRPTVQVLSSMPKAKGGLGIIWKARERLLPDPYHFQDVLSPVKRDIVPDVIKPVFFRRKGQVYSSVKFLSRNRVEREQDLVVAFNSIVLTNSGATPGERVAKMATIYPSSELHKGQADIYSSRAIPSHMNPIASVHAEWLILHANANQSNADFIFHDVLVDSVSHLKGMRERVPFVLEEKKVPEANRTKVAIRSVTGWLRTIITGGLLIVRSKVSRYLRYPKTK